MPEGTDHWPPWLRWLRVPKLPDPDERERAGLLHVMMMATLAVALAAVSFMRFEAADLRVGLPLATVVVALNAAGLVAVRRGRVRIVGLVYCSLIVLVLTTSQLMFGVNAVMLTASLINVTLVAGFTVGGAAALVFGLVAAAWVAGSMWLGALGILPAPPYGQRPVDTAIQGGGPLVVTAILVAYGLSRLRAMAYEARDGKEAMRARAREGALIGDLGRRVVLMRDSEAFSEQVVASVVEALKLLGAAVYRCEGERLRLVSQAGAVDLPGELGLSGEDQDVCRRLSEADQSAVLEAGQLASMAELLRRHEALGLVLSIPRRVAHKGCLLVLARSLEALGQAQMDFLRAAATLLGAAADRAEIETQLRHAQKMEAVGQLAGSVAHDFNNLLTGILGSAELASLEFDSDHPATPLMQDILRAGEHAALLTRQLLVFSRKDDLRPEAVNVREVVSGLERILGRLMGEHIEIHTPGSGEAALVVADRSGLEQIILNLCLNARDAVGRSGRITIEVSIEPGRPPLEDGSRQVLLSVADDGCGMDPAILARIFEPFFTTKGPELGTGLGLATVHTLVHEFEGDIRVQSAPGEGTRFEVRFPLAPVGATPSTSGVQAAAPTGQGELVLLVEDHTLARGALERTLRRSGYRVVTAADGVEALDLLRQYEDVACVVSDLSMPRMRGDELLQLMRRRGQSTPVILLSGYPADAHRVGPALTTQDAPLLAKPIATGDLLRSLRSAIEGARRAEAGA